MDRRSGPACPSRRPKSSPERLPTSWAFGWKGQEKAVRIFLDETAPRPHSHSHYCFTGLASRLYPSALYHGGGTACVGDGARRQVARGVSAVPPEDRRRRVDV